MATPPMLRQPERIRTVSALRPDGVAAITVLLLVACAAGLLVAAVLAVYDYTTPSIESPLVLVLALLFGAVVVLNVAASAVRHLHRP